MLNKKMRMLGILMCAVMMVSSLAVFAGSASGTVGAGEDAGQAYLNVNSDGAFASTEPAYSSSSVSTRVRMVGYYGSTGWNYGGRSAYADPVAIAQYGESYHTINSTTRYLSCNY